MTTYLTDSEGKFIPATQRPDGTWRKARRVKQGYVPQEEVPLYESKGKQFATRSKTGLPPGMCPMVVETTKKERERQEKAKAKKNEKEANTVDIVGTFPEKSTSNKKQKQQATPGMLHLSAPPLEQSTPTSVAAASGGDTMSLLSVPTSNDNVAQSVDDALSTYFIQSLIVQEDAQEVSKKLKKLRKKIREIETVEDKINKGDQKKIDKDQLGKVKRKKDILKEIEQLEQKQREIEAYAEEQKEFQQQQLQLSNGRL